MNEISDMMSMESDLKSELAFHCMKNEARKKCVDSREIGADMRVFIAIVIVTKEEIKNNHLGKMRIRCATSIVDLMLSSCCAVVYFILSSQC